MKYLEWFIKVNELEGFSKIAHYLTNPLVLVGFVLSLFFGIHKLLITSGIIKPVSTYEGSAIVKILLRYGFIIALVTILAGLSVIAWQDYVGSNVRDGEIAFEEVKKEVSENFLTLSLLINVIENDKPTAFSDIRRVNETELAYQDRAKNYFRDYQQQIHTNLQESKYSTARYESYNRNLSYADTNLKESIGNIYQQFNEVIDTFNRFDTGLLHILSLELSDSERTKKTISLHQEKVINAKIAIFSAAAQFCLILNNEIDAKILSKHLALTKIKVDLKSGKEECHQAAINEVSKLYQEKTKVLSARLSPETSAQKEIERRIKDPYLIMLRKTIGLTEDLSESEIYRIKNKQIIDETDPVKLLKLASLSFLESDGSASTMYYDKALDSGELSPALKQYAELSLDRLRNPEKYEGSIGLMVVNINAGGGFDKAGLKIGDVLLSLDGKTLYEPMEIASELGKEKHSPFVLRLIRNNKYMKVVIHSGASLGAVLTQLVVLNTIQL